MNIVIIGSGNVATHLGKALLKNEFNIIQVYSNTLNNAITLAKNLSADYCNDISKLSDKGDLYIISIKDDAISEFINKTNFKNKLIVLTSGSLDMEILKDVSENYGVFYPYQSFSKDIDIDFRNIPICIEANNKKNEETLINIAKRISDKTYIIDSEKRKILHLAGVFANNFTNHMYSIAETLLQENDLDFEIIKPLIAETAKKVMLNKPADVQTGPAIRKDTKIIKKHLEQLKNHKSLHDIYKIITESFMTFNKSNKKSI